MIYFFYFRAARIRDYGIYCALSWGGVPKVFFIQAVPLFNENGISYFDLLCFYLPHVFLGRLRDKRIRRAFRRFRR